eukprot:1497650-Rhodomonas_salina.1
MTLLSAAWTSASRVHSTPLAAARRRRATRARASDRRSGQGSANCTTASVRCETRPASWGAESAAQSRNHCVAPEISSAGDRERENGE